jgi:hypothetical protein
MLIMDGLWTIEFGSTAGRFGAGVVVLRDGIIMGGDNGYFYLGTYELLGPREFEAVLNVTPFVEGIESVFLTLGRNIQLKLSGALTSDGHATARGYPVAMPDFALGVKLVRRT